jgi:16S rRNA processing protein RimM
MNREANGEFITLARVVKTQGRRGEVAAEVHSDFPGRFTEGMRLFALPPGTEETRRELKVETLWLHKEFLVLKFLGVDSISEAESLVRFELQVPSSERAKLESGWNYVSDLAGCSVFDHGIAIGRIEDVQFGAGEAPMLIVAGSSGKKFDVPFAEAYLESLDVARKQVRMNLPEGMLEINSPVSNEEKREQARPAEGRNIDHRGSQKKSSRRTPRPLQ